MIAFPHFAGPAVAIESPMELRARLQESLGNGYTIGSELGGGMSRVLRARDTVLNRDVVIKLLHPALVEDVSIERFKREILLAASLQHPHIVPVLSAGEFDGLPYYIMPFVEGESLRARLDAATKLSIPAAVAILRDIAKALAFAHAREIVHRDIKPDNVLLSDGVAVLTDLGIAKAISAARGHPQPIVTQTGVSVGTPGYMAPEQIAGEEDVDARADVYAFGVLAYEMLAGRNPWAGVEVRRLMAAQMVEPPAPLDRVRPETPPRLAALVARCLQNDPSNRPASAVQVVDELDHVARELAGSSEVASALTDVRRHFVRALVAYGVAFPIVLLIARAAMIGIGLPDWVVPGVVAVMALGLPMVMLTGLASGVGYARATSQGSALDRALAALAALAAPYVSWRRTTAGGVAALTGFALFTGGFMTMRSLGIGPPASLFGKGTLRPKETILVSDFGVSRVDSTVGSAIAVATRAALAQSSAVTLVPAGTVTAALTRMQRSPTSIVDQALGREIATREGIRAVVAGHVLRTGSSYDIGLRLITADSGNDLVVLRASAPTIEDVIPTVDDLTRQLRAKIGESLKAVRATPPLPRVTTRSLEALRLYAASEQTDQQKGLLLLNQAVQADSEFAMAWRKMWVFYSNLRIASPLAESAIVKARRYSARLPEAERLGIEALYSTPSDPASTRFDRARAIAAYERLLGLGGDSTRWLINLAEDRWTRREYAVAESLDKLNLKQTADVPRRYRPMMFGNLAVRQIEQGKLDAADTTLRTGLLRFPGAWEIQQWRIQLLYLRGGLTAYERALDSVRQLPNPGTRRIATGIRRDLALLRGKLGDWSRLNGELRALDVAAGGAASAATDAFTAASIDVWIRRDTARAVRTLLEMSKTGELSRRDLLSYGQLLAQAGRADLARGFLARYEATADTAQRRADAPLVSRLRAHLAIADGQPVAAVAAMRQGDVLADGPIDDCHVCSYLRLGEVFDRLNQTDSAIASFQRYVETPHSSRSTLVDPLHLARVLRRLGELHEARGNRGEAGKYYEQFAELWRDADPELQPQVTGVARKLARLRDGT